VCGAGLAAFALIGCNIGNPTASSDDASLRLQGSAANGSDSAKKVTICHLPPGNPENAHTLSVGAPAVKAHLAHGDYLGACAEVPPTDNNESTVTNPPTGTETGTGTETETGTGTDTGSGTPEAM
jgi:hypothetical protein